MAETGKLSSKKKQLLAKLKRKRNKMESQAKIPPITPVPREEGALFPLSRAQQRLMFNYLQEPTASGQNVGLCHSLKGDLNLVVLEKAVNDLMERHEILRAAYVTKDNETFMRLPPVRKMSLVLHDCEGWSQKKLEQSIQKTMDQFFDLPSGETFAVHIFKKAADHHYLLIVQHHIVSDGWSLKLLPMELVVLYNAHLDGLENPLPPQALQYLDFASWEASWLKDQALEEKLGYWKKRLAGVPPLDFPTDQPRPKVQDIEADSLIFEIDLYTTMKLREVSRTNGLTLFMSMLGIYQIALFHFTGQHDIAIGTTYANRSKAEVEAMLGFFVNLLVLRSPLDSDASLLDYLKVVKKTVLGAFANPEIGLGELIGELNLKWDPSRNPLFQAVFAMENTAGATDQLRDEIAGETDGFKGIDGEHYDLDANVTNYDLSLSLSHYGESHILATLLYSKHLFRPTTMEGFARHLKHLIKVLMEAPDVPLSKLDVVDPQSRQLQLDVWNQTAHVLPKNQSLYDLIDAAFSDEGAPAVRLPDCTYDYRSFRNEAGRFAARYEAAGVGCGDVVAICLPPGYLLLAGMLGAFQIGAVYLPLDPAATDARLRFMLEDSQTKVLVTREETAESLSDFDGTVLTNPGAHISERRTSVPDGPAYIIYTSGSTGKPKGVMIRHTNAINFVTWWNLELSQKDALAPMPVMSNPIFDASINQLVAPLVRGAYVWFIDPDVKRDPARLVELLRQENAFSILLPNSLWYAMLDVIEARGLGFDDFNFRFLALGGEKANEEAFQRSLRLLPELVFLNVYGPTETTVIVTTSRIQIGETVHIGRPVINTQTYIHNRHGQLLPVGGAGELLIGGDSVGMGYLNRPGLTARQFVPDPYSSEPGRRLYRSGDLVRFQSNGNMDYLGRIDQQVKIRGFRIELEEIESALLTIDKVQGAAVVVQKLPSGDPALVAFLVGELEIGDVRNELAAMVPDYMVPAAFSIIDAIPTGPTGKMDRKQLQNTPVRMSRELAYRAPERDIEIQIATMMGEVLGVDRVGMDDSFFELGGHSMLAMRFVTQLSQALRIEIPVGTVFQHTTVASLSEAIDGLSGQKQLPPIQANAPKPAPLSFAQQRLWVIYQLEGPSPTYNIPMIFYWNGPLSVDLFEQALRRLVARHEVLRTRYVMEDSLPKQVVDAALPPLDLVDLRGKANRDSYIRPIVSGEVQRGFKLESELPIRTTLLRLKDDQHLLVLNVHHIAFDGGSTPLLINELQIAYSQAAGRKIQAPELAVSYGDYAHWQRETYSGAFLEEKLAYWKKQLAGIPGLLELPTDFQRPKVQSFRGASESFSIDENLRQRLESLTMESGGTLFMTLLGAFGLLLGRYARQDDVVIGTPAANRAQEPIQNLIGYFANTWVLRVHKEGDPSVKTFFENLATEIQGSLNYNDMPFDYLVEALNPPRSLAYSPVFQVMFSFIHEALEEDEGGAVTIPDVRLLPYEADSGGEAAKFDLHLTMAESGPDLEGTLNYAVDLFDAETIKRFIKHYTRFLTGISANLDARLSDIEIMDDAERHELLVSFNETDDLIVPGLTVHEAFEVRSQMQPKAEALFDSSEVRLAGTDYGQLNRESNRLAHSLRRLGVKRGVRVGILGTRRLNLVVGMLAILKAGGTYVPTDPAYPIERIIYTLENAKVNLVLTNGEHYKLLLGQNLKILQLDKPKGWSRESSKNLPVYNRPEDLSHIIYTSGSTGKPKGVAIPHRAVVSLATWARHRYTEKQRAVVLAATSICFDLSVFEIFATLLAGGTVALAENVLQLPRLASADRVTMINTVPSAITELLGVERGIPSEVCHVNLAGEALRSDLVARLQARGLTVSNLYGPSEDTTYSTEAHLSDSGTPPIGRPLPGTRAYVVDEAFQPTPIGVPGELVLSGAGLARGYLDAPALTAASFLPDDLSGVAGSRIYRTGDLVYFRSDGQLMFLGRIDHQVKLRGFRIELGEIEAALLACDGVDQSVVLMLGEGLNQRLHAFVEGRERSEHLREVIARHLPAYMVPSEIQVLERLPQLPNGKIDRKALPGLAKSTVHHEYIAPRTYEQAKVARFFSEILNRDKVGLYDDFFASGGHSLAAVRLTALIFENTGKRIPLAAIFQYPTVALLSDFLEEDMAGDSMEIHSGSAEDIVWLLPPVGGQSHHYIRLAERFDCKVKALEDPRLREGHVANLGLDELVNHYQTLIQSEQPEGPYRLGGWSMGGILAYELTRNLEKEGHEVEELILLDTHYFDPLRGSDVYRGRPQLLKTFLGEQGLTVTDELGSLKDEELLVLARERGMIRSDAEAAELKHAWLVLIANARALHGWAADRRIKARIHHIIASETRDIYPGTQDHWSKISSDFKGEVIEGNHFDVLSW